MEKWDTAQAKSHDTLVDISTGFGVFRLRGEKQFVHERDALQIWWRQQIAAIEENDTDVLGQCLVTGEFGPLARLHEPKIKGAWGAQSAGALLVSFNDSAYESYGRESKMAGYNAPIREQAAFQ